MGGRRGPRPLLHLRGTFGDSRHRLQSALSTLLGDGAVSMCRPMFHVRDIVSAASEVLGSSSPYALVMPEALACRRTVLVSPDRVTCCTWNSALRRAAAGSQKSRRPLPAELERLTYV